MVTLRKREQERNHQEKGFLKIFLTHARPGFPDSSVGKEFACNAGDPGSIPGPGRSAGEGIGYPLKYSWASLVAQRAKNLPPNAGDLGSFPGLERSAGGGTPVFLPGKSHGRRSLVEAW